VPTAAGGQPRLSSKPRARSATTRPCVAHSDDHKAHSGSNTTTSRLPLFASIGGSRIHLLTRCHVRRGRLKNPKKSRRLPQLAHRTAWPLPSAASNPYFQWPSVGSVEQPCAFSQARPAEYLLFTVASVRDIITIMRGSKSEGDALAQSHACPEFHPCVTRPYLRLGVPIAGSMTRQALGA